MVKYRCLVGVTNDDTGKHFKAGDIITGEDFQDEVIEGWLTMLPPVLEVVGRGKAKEEVKDAEPREE